MRREQRSNYRLVWRRQLLRDGRKEIFVVGPKSCARGRHRDLALKFTAPPHPAHHGREKMTLKLHGVSRMADNEQALLVIFNRKLSDGELRRFHDAVRSADVSGNILEVDDFLGLENILDS
jgi:hypothetical protein